MKVRSSSTECVIWIADRIRDIVYAMLVIMISPLIFLLFRVSVQGLENLRHGGVIVARHRSYWDILILCVAFGPFHRINFLARRGLLRNPVFAPFVWGFATVIDREAFGQKDFQRALRAAERAHLVGVFPEGTTRRRVPPKSGAIRLAERLGRPLIPVNIVPKGPYPPAKFLRLPIRFPKVEVRIGHPISVEELAQGLPSLPRPKRYRLLSEQLMERIDSV